MVYARINQKNIKETVYGSVIRCPVCGYEMISNAWLSGETTRCPRCGAMLRIK